MHYRKDITLVPFKDIADRLEADGLNKAAEAARRMDVEMAGYYTPADHEMAGAIAAWVEIGGAPLCYGGCWTA